jgi:hypothetical protein
MTKPKPKPETRPEATWRVVCFSGKRLRQKHYFRIVGANGKILVQSEGYTRAIDRDASAHLIADPAGAQVT